MANKAVSIAHSRVVTTQDDWVNQKPEPAKPSEPMIRLSVDLPDSLHTRLKLACVAKQQNMADEVRGLIERHVGAPG